MSSKLREALEKFNAVDLSGFEFPLDGDSSTIYNSNKKEITIPYWRVAELLNKVKAAQDMAKSALSEPPRNCDKLFTSERVSADDVEQAWIEFRRCDLNVYFDVSGLLRFIVWLFAESKGETK